MDTGPHYGITLQAIKNISWFPKHPDIIKFVQVFNWFPDYLSIIDLYKFYFYTLSWIDYIPLPFLRGSWLQPKAQLYHDLWNIRKLSQNTIAEKKFHHFHFDNLFNLNSILNH